MSTLTESETGGNCETLCLAADSLLEEARAREESGDLSVSKQRQLRVPIALVNHIYRYCCTLTSLGHSTHNVPSLRLIH